MYFIIFYSFKERLTMTDQDKNSAALKGPGTLKRTILRSMKMSSAKFLCVCARILNMILKQP